MKKAGVLLGLLILAALVVLCQQIFASSGDYCVNGKYTNSYGLQTGIDGDGDKWDIQCGDCDDADKTSFPNSPYSECDGKDRNCDGVISCSERNSLVSAEWSNSNAIANSSVNLIAESLIGGESVSFDVYRKNNGSCESQISSNINANDANLVSLYHFDSNAGDAKNRNNGEVHNAVFADGKIGQALYFNGKDSYVKINDSSSLELQNNFSVELWFKANSSEDANQILLSKGLNYQIRYDSIAGKLSFYIPSLNDLTCEGTRSNLYQGSSFYPYQTGNINDAWKINAGFGAGAEDINGDGYDDAVVVSKNDSGSGGKVSVYLGSDTGLSSIPFSVLDGINSWGTGSDGGLKAGVVSGDFNHDGYGDIAVSTGNITNSLIYIYYGNKTGVTKGWSKSLARPFNIYNYYVQMGYLPLVVGDTNKDRYDDLVIGENFASSNKGKVEIFRGSSSGLSSTSFQNLSSSQTSCYFGSDVALGDVNKDGNLDLLVGAPGCNVNGSAYLYLGNSVSYSSSSLVGGAIKNDYFEWRYSGADLKYGVSVALGDINGDGYDDPIVGQMHYTVPWHACEFRADTGVFLVYYASSLGVPSEGEYVAYANGNGQVTNFPYILKAEDIDKDGYDEILQTSPFTDVHADVGGGISTANIFHFNPSIGEIPWPYWCDNTCGDYKTFNACKADGYSIGEGDFNGDGAGDIIMSNSYAFQDDCDSMTQTNLASRNYTFVFSDKPYEKLEIALPNPNEWHHLGVVYDGEMKLYLDGILSASREVNANVNPVVAPLIIGAEEGKYSFSSSKNFNGDIDEVLIWDKALSQNEIKQHYNSGDVKIASVDSALALAGDSGVPDNNLLLLYSFNNNLYDSSSNKNDATCSGTSCPIFNSSGKFNSALQFDGSNDYLTNSIDSILPSLGTISFWINLDDNSSENIFRISGNSYDAFSIYVSNGKINVRMNAGGLYSDRWKIQGTSNLEKGKWYNIALTHDGIQPRLYIDGREEGIVYLTDNARSSFLSRLSSLNSASIGKSGDAGYLDGKIDDFAIYNKVLTANEISDVYLGSQLKANKTSLESESSWIADYKDEGDCNPPQYYFIVKSMNSEVKSGLLGVNNYQGSCSDGDGDGFSPEGGKCGLVDCNDNLNIGEEIYPNAVENCTDSRDNNCNGLVDYDESSCYNSASSPLYIFRESPKETEYTYSNISFSISTNKPASCVYSLNNFLTNYSMQGTGKYFSDTKYILSGSHVADFSCQDSFGNSALKSSAFSVSASAFCVDADNDGYSIPTEGVSVDDCGGIYNIDCNDSNSQIHPYAEETCIDNATCSQDLDCIGGDYKKELVAYYSFENDSTGYSTLRRDSSNYSNDGLAPYQNTNIVQGKIGKGLRLGLIFTEGRAGMMISAGYFTINRSISMAFDKEFSISFWDYNDYVDDATLISHVRGEDYGVPAKMGYKIGIEQGKPYLMVGDGVNYTISRKSFSMPLKEWHHYVFVYDGKNKESRIYMDGELKETSSMMNMISSSGLGTSIGDNYEKDLQNTILDEVKFFNYALNNNEIESEYSRGIVDEAPKPITNCQQLQNISSNLWGNYYLTQDIDCSGVNFVPIGGASINEVSSDVNYRLGYAYFAYFNGFYGNFDGRNFKIKNINIEKGNYDGAGLFGAVSGSIKNLAIEDANVNANESYNYCGGLAGINRGEINNAHFEGKINCSSYEGGLVGYNFGEISNSSVSAVLFGAQNIGGLVGINRGDISQSFSRVKGLDAETVIGRYYGSFFYSNYGSIDNSYSVAGSPLSTSLSCTTFFGRTTCTCSNYTYIEGFGIENAYYGTSPNFTYGEVHNSYNLASVNFPNCTFYFGGFLYLGGGNCSDTFWDNNTIGMNKYCGAGKTTSQMKQQATYTNWDFNNIWRIDSGNNGYPYLSWENSTPSQDTTPPYFTNLANQNLSLGQSLNYNIDAQDESGISCFKVNDTANFNIDCNGLLKNKTALTLGTYYLNISVNDTYNNINSAVIWINVSNIDNIPPYFTSIPSQANLLLGQSLGVGFSATDNIALSSFSINWSNTFSINSLGWLKNISALSIGLYNLNITINDSSNNRNSTIYTVNVSSSCIQNLANTTATGWRNLSCIGNKMNQSRNWTEYDSNNCGTFTNITFFEYQQVNNFTNTSYGAWNNISCLPSNTMNQTRNSTQYDSYGCGINITNFEYRNTLYCQYDTTPPYVAFISPVSGVYSTSNVTVTIANNSDAKYIWWNNGTKNFSYTSPINVSLANGDYVFYAYANDSFGNKNSTSVSFNVNYNPADIVYPSFSLYQDNNGTIINSGTALFNVTVANTNGSVFLNINGSKIIATNVSNKYSASLSLTSGVYSYNWTAYGNGVAKNLNVSPQRSYTVKQGQCIVDTDCASKCSGVFWNSLGVCNSGTCSYTSTNCSSSNGWQDTVARQWISTGDCTEKEQKQQEYRNYSCNNGCVYAITQTRWTDTGNTRNKADGTSCNDNSECTLNDICSSGTCGGTTINCDDGIACTVDSCNPTIIGGCVHNADNTKCSDAFSCTDNVCQADSGCQFIVNDSKCGTGEKCLLITPSTGCSPVTLSCIGQPDGTYCEDGLNNCTVGKTCLNQLCQGGQVKDCSSNNKSKIDSCSDASDSNPFTRDYRDVFVSSCIGDTGVCTQAGGISHSCNISCGGCEKDSDVKCSSDSCSGNYFADYPANGKCNLQTCVGDNSTNSGCKPSLVDDLRCRAEINVSININSGINFISVPLLLNNYSISKVFAGNLDKIDRIYGYNNGWKVYYSSNPSLSNLQELNSSRGYILFAKDGGSFNLKLTGYNKLNISGVISRPSFSLNQGWNLVGSFSKTGNVSSVFSGLNYSAVFSYDFSGYVLLENSSTIDNTKAYWIYMNSAGVFNP